MYILIVFTIIVSLYFFTEKEKPCDENVFLALHELCWLDENGNFKSKTITTQSYKPLKIKGYKLVRYESKKNYNYYTYFYK